MGDKPTILTTDISDDDFVDNHFKNTNLEDGGNSFGMRAQLQGGTHLSGLSYSMYTSHTALDANNIYHTTNERDALAVLEAFSGQVRETPIHDTSIQALTYGQVAVSYNDRQVAPIIQDWFHKRSGLKGRPDMEKLYEASRAPQSVNLGVAAAGELQRDYHVGNVEIRPDLHAAMEAYTNGQAASAGLGLAIGHGIDRMPHTLPVANPENTAPTYVVNPDTHAGDWVVHATADQHVMAQNRYLYGAPNNHAVTKAAMDAAYAISKNLTLTASAEEYDNPAKQQLDQPNPGPKRDYSVRFGITRKF